MKLVFLFSIIFRSSLWAQDACDECEPLAEVSITNSGFEKIIHKTVTEQLKQLNEFIRKKSNFRDLKTKVGNYSAEINGMKLTDLKISLDSPIKCTNLKCKFEVKVDSMSMNGNLEIIDTSKQEIFVPKNNFTLSTSSQAKFKFSGEAFLNPQEGKLDQLVFLNEQQTNASMTPGSLNLDMTLKKPFPNKKTEIKLYAENYRRYIKKDSFNSKQVDESFKKYFDHLVFRTVATNESIPKGSVRERESAAAKIVTASIEKEYGSVEALKTKMTQVNWPDSNDDQAIYEFMNRPPKEIAFYSDVQQSLAQAEVAAIAQNSGFNSPEAFQMAMVGVAAANSYGGESFVNNTVAIPLLNKEVVPQIHKEINAELRNLSSYWDNLSKVPALDKSREKTSWLPLETAVLVDQNTRGNKLIKFQLTKSNSECSSYPKKFSDDSDADFDVRTTLKPNTIQEYFDTLAKNNKLNFCLGVPEKNSCPDGEIKINPAPKIRCENGNYIIDLDANIKRSIFNADIQGKVSVKISNCSGSPCFELSDSSGRFKNVFLGTFFSGLLEKALTGAAKDGSYGPIPLTEIRLKQTKTNSQCASSLDWTVNN